MTMSPDEHALLARVDERTALIVARLDEIAGDVRTTRDMQARHDEQIKQLRAGGGGVVGLLVMLGGAWLKQKAGL